MVRGVCIMLLGGALATSTTATAQQIADTPMSFNNALQISFAIDPGLRSIQHSGSQSDPSIVALLRAVPSEFSLLRSSLVTSHAEVPNLLQLSREVSRYWEAESRNRNRATAVLGLNGDFYKAEPESSDLTVGNRFLNKVARLLNREVASEPPAGPHICRGGSLQISPMPCGSGAR